MKELLGPIGQEGVLALVFLLVIKEVIKGGQFTVGFVKRKRSNGKRRPEPEGKKIVICPMDQAGAVEKINTLERHQEQQLTVLIEMGQGIATMTGQLTQLIQGQSQQNDKLGSAVKEQSEVLKELSTAIKETHT